VRFYYFSPISWALFLVYAALAIGIISAVWGLALKVKFRSPIFWVLIAAALVAPWVEELSIAHEFDQLCRKDAGFFVNRTVTVDGFYDDTNAWSPKRVRENGFKFVEGRDGITRTTIWRHEYVDGQIRSIKIDKPTARYWFIQTSLLSPVAYRIGKNESLVKDNRTGEVLARYTDYRRSPYWFFISGGVPLMPCREAEDGLRKYRTPLAYEIVLKPSK
jgi:hypothetical protein